MRSTDRPAYARHSTRSRYRNGDGSRQWIVQLTESKLLTRQAISKHMRILESAGASSRCTAG
jgi:hypothetical protein